MMKYKGEIPDHIREKVHLSYMNIGTIYLVRLLKDPKVQDPNNLLEANKTILKYYSQAIEFSENKCKVYGYVGRILARIPADKNEIKEKLLEFIRTEILNKESLVITEENLYKAEIDSATSELDKAYAIANIGGYYKNEKRYEESLHYLSMALELRRKNLGEEHRQTSDSYKQIGFLSMKLGEYEKAIENFYKALMINNKKGKYNSFSKTLVTKLKECLDILCLSGKKYFDDEKIREEVKIAEIENEEEAEKEEEVKELLLKF